ncbi:MAG: HNH endonuclease signature motif containing protein, partial [Acidimicrobiia bacterium]
PDEPDPEPTAPKDRLSFGATRNGRWKISGEFGLDDGRRIEAAVAERRDGLFTGGDEDVTWSEAFVDCMERSLDAVESGSRRDRFRTWLHLDVTDGEATTTDGWRVPMAVRDRILCDGTIAPVWQRDGVPFSVGRAQHVVPDRTRRIVEQRDRGCRVPGCTRDRFVEIHHIVHWNQGGPTDTWNLVSLCAKHHKLHHQGRLGITGDADLFDGLVFTDPDGHPVTEIRPPTPPTGPPPEPQVAYRAPLADRFDWNWIGLGWVHPNARRQHVQRAKQLADQYHRTHHTHTAA